MNAAMDSLNIKIENDDSCSAYAVSAGSIQGNRETQQDHGYIHIEKANLFAVICDGMGGMQDGDLASKVAVEALEKCYKAGVSLKGADFLMFSLQKADSAVCSACKMRGGTTAVEILIAEKQLYWASAGDSSLYIIRSTEIVKVTRNHNYYLQLNALLNEGIIDKEYYETESVRGNALISYLGIGGLKVLDITNKPMPLLSGDFLLLATDGLTNCLSKSEIMDIINHSGDLEKSMEALFAMVQNKVEIQGIDNTTAILIKVL